MNTKNSKVAATRSDTRMTIRRSLPVLLLISATFGVALTGFYFVHEGLPRVIRAPSSLILAPVAVVDGLCYAIGVRGIYGRPVPVFVVNWAFGLAISFAVLGAKNWLRKRKPAAPDADHA